MPDSPRPDDPDRGLDGGDPTDPFADAPDAWAEVDRAYAQKWADPDEADDALDALQAEPDPFSPDIRYRPDEASTRRVYNRATGREIDPSSPIGAYGHGMMAAGPYLGLGVQIAASMAVFTGGGYLVDRWLGSTPWGLLVGAALGMAGIVALIVRISREADAQRDARKAKK